MKRIYLLRKRAKNPFTKITGLKAIQLDGGCLIVEQNYITRLPKYVSKPTQTKFVAAYLYLTQPQILTDFGYEPLMPLINEYTFTSQQIKRVKQTCGITQCVNPRHLQISIEENNNWAS